MMKKVRIPSSSPIRLRTMPRPSTAMSRPAMLATVTERVRALASR